jgi:hypothetical protein
MNLSKGFLENPESLLMPLPLAAKSPGEGQRAGILPSGRISLQLMLGISDIRILRISDSSLRECRAEIRSTPAPIAMKPIPAILFLRCRYPDLIFQAEVMAVRMITA